MANEICDVVATATLRCPFCGDEFTFDVIVPLSRWDGMFDGLQRQPYTGIPLRRPVRFTPNSTKARHDCV